MRLGKILCAVDFSPAARAAMHYAAELCRTFGASLTLLHVYQVPIYPLPDGYIPLEATAVNESFARIDASLATWQEDAREHGAASIEVVSIQGSPWAEIVRLAQQDRFGLIVLGKHGHSALRERIIGSVTERVVRHATCPVLMVHAEDEHAAE